MKSVIKLFVIVFLTSFCISCMQRVDAGHEGIKVNLYGSD